MFSFSSSNRSSLPAELPSSVKGKLRSLHLRSRSFTTSDATPASPQRSFDRDDDNGDAFYLDSPPSYVVDGSPPPPPPFTSFPGPGRHAVARSFSSPLLSTRYQTDVYHQAAHTSMHSVRPDSRYAADVPPFFVVKPLSPIAEQDYFSPERQSLALPPDDMVVSTPTGSQYSGIARPSPIYSTFINRPLNRSTSQTSSRTQVSSSSAPPSIPPLDLRPSFSGHINVPPIRMPKAAVVRPMPTIEGSSEGYTGMYDDGSSLRAESFMTAESVVINSGSGAGRDSPQRGRYSDPFNPSGSISSSQLIHTSIPSIASQARSSRSAQSSSSSSASTSISFFERRWRRSESYGSGLAISSFPKIPKPLCGSSLTPACWLFLLGFIAPWCWIIGGWYYTIRGQRRPRYSEKGGKRDLVLPMWVMTKKGLGGVRLTEKEAHSQGVWFGYPFVATAVDNEFKTSATRLDIRSPPIIRTKRPRVLDPWIFRCRVAAIASGFLLMIGFIVAFVVVQHKFGSH